MTYEEQLKNEIQSMIHSVDVDDVHKLREELSHSKVYVIRERFQGRSYV